MKRTLLTFMALSLIASACGGDDVIDTTTTQGPGTSPPTTTAGPDTTAPTTSAGPGTTAPPTGDATVMLTILDEGGFAPVEMIINRPPTYVLLADGTLFFEGPQPGIFPGPLMPGMQRTKLNEDQMEDVTTLIEASGLPEIDEIVNNDAANFVADASSTVAIYTDRDGGTHRYEVYALGIMDPMPDDLANLALLRETLANFAFAGSAGEPYTSDRLVVRILEGGGFTEINDTRPWEFPFEPGDLDPLNNFPCGVFAGAEAEPVRALLGDATIATQWEHGTGPYMVLARDLLPGEVGCDIR